MQDFCFFNKDLPGEFLYVVVFVRFSCTDVKQK